MWLYQWLITVGMWTCSKFHYQDNQPHQYKFHCLIKLCHLDSSTHWSRNQLSDSHSYYNYHMFQDNLVHTPCTPSQVDKLDLMHDVMKNNTHTHTHTHTHIHTHISPLTHTHTHIILYTHIT